MPEEQPFQLEHGHTGIGQICEVCHKPFAEGDRVIACPRCKQLHHAECWHDRGGCARRGCPQLASTIHEERPRITDDDRAKEYVRPLPKWVPWTVGVLVVTLLFGIPLMNKYVFADKRPKIRVMLPAGTDEPLVQAVAELYAENHPELQTEVITAPSGGMYQQKLLIMVGARDAPDIFVLPYASFTQFVSMGLYADLSEWVESEPTALSRLPAERLQRGRVDDVWYSVPHPSRPLYFGVYAGSPLVDESVELLEQIIARLPVDENVEDPLTVQPYVPLPIRP